MGVPLSTGVCGLGSAVSPPQNFFLNFYIKIVSFRAFWVAISYRLADCFTRIGNRLRLELKFTGDRSSILGTRPIIIPSGKLRAQNVKNAPKINKGNCAKIAFFLVHFRIYSLKIF